MSLLDINSFATHLLASVNGADPDWLTLLMRSAGFLLLLGVLAYGVTRLGRNAVSSSGLRAHGKIRVSDCKPLGNRQFLVVAEYGSNKHLIGVSSGKIEHLAKLESDDRPLPGVPSGESS